MYNQVFGGLVNLKNKLGIITNHYGAKPTKKQLIDNYYKLQKKIGKVTRLILKLSNGSKYTAVYYQRVFGSWLDFLKIVDKGNHRFITQKDIKREYYRLKKVLGRQPLYIDFCYKNKKSKFSNKLIDKRFGGWKEFMKYLKVKK